jgi:hypothetical protein
MVVIATGDCDKEGDGRGIGVSVGLSTDRLTGDRVGSGVDEIVVAGEDGGEAGGRGDGVRVGRGTAVGICVGRAADDWDVTRAQPNVRSIPQAKMRQRNGWILSSTTPFPTDYYRR